MSKYSNWTSWNDRTLKEQRAIVDKTIVEVEAQLRKYYRSTMKRVIKDFEDTYNKLLATMEAGREPTPADLYNLSRFWELQVQLRDELQKLGDKQVKLLSNAFEKEYKQVYKALARPSDPAFAKINTNAAKQMLQSTWLADGKNFSQRIWKNRDKLMETLNENLTDCIIRGKNPDYLIGLLEERFNVSYNQASTLVHTEAAHIQTQAAAQKYKDDGTEEFEFIADPDEKTCSVCGKLDGVRKPFSELIPGVTAPPMHPRCRCCIAAVAKDDDDDDE